MFSDELQRIGLVPRETANLSDGVMLALAIVFAFVTIVCAMFSQRGGGDDGGES